MKPKEPKPALRADRLYLGDNGRTFCGESRCAGASAFYSGRTINGQEVLMITPPDVDEFERIVGRMPSCECCGKKATRIWTADDLYVAVAS